MMSFVRLAALAAALAAAAPALAQQRAGGQPRVGLGVSLPTDDVGTAFNVASIAAGRGAFSTPQIYVPIVLHPNVRLEPQLGWISVTDDEDDETDSAFTLGIGALFVAPVAAQTQLYGGVRLASTWTKVEDHVGPGGALLSETTARNTTLAAAFGGEYLPTPWFSVGLEAQLSYIVLGDPETETAGLPTVRTQGGNAKALQGLLFMRVYFL